MNTIIIDDIIYTAGEVMHFKTQLKLETEYNAHMKTTMRAIRNEVYNYFKELDWDSNSATVDFNEVNELLTLIGCAKLLQTYSATVIINAQIINIEAENENDIQEILQDSISIDCIYDYDISDISIENIRQET